MEFAGHWFYYEPTHALHLMPGAQAGNAFTGGARQYPPSTDFEGLMDRSLPQHTAQAAKCWLA